MIKKIVLERRKKASELSGVAGAEQFFAILISKDGDSLELEIIDATIKTDRTSFMTKVDLIMDNGMIHIDDAEIIIKNAEG